MFEFGDIRVERGGKEILRGVGGSFRAGAMHAVVGPSGCGKTTLVRALLGLVPSTGFVRHASGDARKRVADAGIGFVPQFGVAHGKLKVREVLEFTLRLAFADAERRRSRLDEILALVGLPELAETEVASLSGGQSRRLGLATELVREPAVLFCDEVTSGLDPRSEKEILGILRRLVRENGITVVCVIHNLERLGDFDTVSVLSDGRMIFAGERIRLQALLAGRNWSDLYDFLENEEHDRRTDIGPPEGGPSEQPPPEIAAGEGRPPSVLSQFRTLMSRRLLLFGRDTGYLWLFTILTLGFPCLVVVFALGGLPELEGLSLVKSGSYLEELRENLRFRMEAAETASLATGLILFQVVLLALMGANNGAREIADERAIYEKERLGGLQPLAYVVSKLIFTATLVLGQGVWMTLFVKVICQFPGSFPAQALALGLGCLAMTWICLGLSAVLPSGDRASLLSIYLVGFQLPLSGIVLALPEALIWVLRPVITTYWSWAGYLSTMKEFRIYDAFRLQDSSWIPGPTTAVSVLLLQGLVGAVMVFAGCMRRRGF